MIQDQLDKKRNKANLLLIYIGIIITAAVLIFVLYISWVNYKDKERELLRNTISQLTNKGEMFFNGLYKQMDKVPSPLNITECDKKTLSALRGISFETTAISAAFVTNKDGKVICSTVKDFDILPVNLRSGKTQLNGPFFNRYINQSYFLLIRKKDNHIEGLYLLGSTLKKIIHSNEPHISTAILYNQNTHQPMIIADFKNQTTYATGSHPFKALASNNTMANAKLKNVDNIQLILISDRLYVMKKIWSAELIFVFITLLLAGILYYLFRRILMQRYSFKTILQMALKSEQFFPLYQPMFNTELKKYTGIEVLVRWRNSAGDLIAPDQFIQEAENTGIIFPIMGYLIERSYKEVKTILDQDPSFHISFNFTQEQIKDKLFLDEFIRLTEKYDIRPTQVVLELTERYLPDFTDEETKEIILFLQSKGYSLAIDDFGTGHASISYLRQFPFDYLKIDKLYIQSIGTGSVTEKLAKNIIDMAVSLKITMIAEGVETKEQLDYVTEHGISLIQGWYYSKAISSEKLQEFLKQGNIENND